MRTSRRNTRGSSEYSEAVENLPGRMKLDASWMKHESARSPVERVLGVRVSETELNLHHEDDVTCWCSPLMFPAGNGWTIVVHNHIDDAN